MTKENRSINILKAFACILVVLNHFHGTKEIGTVTYTVSHLGVPLFFLVSGYFLYNSDNKLVLNRLPSKVLHIALLFLVHMLLYLYLDILKSSLNKIDKATIICQLKKSFSFSQIKNSLIWSTTLYGTAQWFLIALLQAYIIFWIIYKLKLHYFIEKFSLQIAFILFLIHIPMRLLLIKLGVTHIGNMNIFLTPVVRNVWFDAIPFMLVGFSMRQKDYLSKVKTKTLLVIVCFAILFSILEGYLTVYIMKPFSVSCVLYFGTIIAISLMFYLATRNPSINNKYLNYIGKNLSLVIYFIHPIIGNAIIKLTGKLTCCENICPLIIVICSIIVAYIIHIFISFISLKNKKIVNILTLLATIFLVIYLLVP